MSFYANFTDFAGGNCYVGPFATQAEVAAHIEFCKQHNGGEYTQTVTEVPADEVVFTPAEDRSQLLSA